MSVSLTRYFFMGKYMEAASAASRAMAASPRFSVPRYLHTAALICLNRIEEAKIAAAVVLEVQPGLHSQRPCLGKHHDAGAHGDVD